MPDPGAIATDKAYAAAMKKIETVYKKAVKDLTAKMQAFTKQHLEQDKKKRALLAAGEITEEAYKQWLTSQIFQGKRWEEKVRDAAETLSHANAEAAALVQQGRLTAFAANANYGAYKLDHDLGLNTGWTLYSRESVSRIVSKNPKMLPEWKIDEPKDYIWNEKKVQDIITQGIIQGESIPDITTRMVDGLQTQNENKMRNFARTAMTGAQNAGRIDSMHHAQDLGIKIRKKWLATRDARTRDAHEELDGQVVDIDEPFITHNRDGSIAYIDHPGDPNADPEQVYNCRCTMINVYPDLDDLPEDTEPDPEARGMSYDEWVETKENREAVQGQVKTEHVEVIDERQPELPVVQGTDISETWERRKGEFNTEIEDVINAQGFDGNPRLVGQEEFDRAVEESGFVAQRSYSAPDKETLDAYREQLYNGGEGNWYVDCGTGGAQYGQGMYCAADYTGTITDGMQAEMEHYSEIGESRFRTAQTEYAEKVYQEEIAKVDSPLDKKYRDAMTDEFGITDLGTKATSEEREYVREWMKANPEEAERLNAEYSAAQQRGVEKGTAIERLTKDEFKEAYPDHAPQSYTETFTLTPDAKIISYDDLDAMRTYSGMEKRIADSLDLPEETRRTLSEWAENSGDISDLPAALVETGRQIEKRADKMMAMDPGSLATLLGYDAINAQGHGESGSYTVILNRTKVIILDGRK